jgi:nicotinamidase-related amidase
LRSAGARADKRVKLDPRRDALLIVDVINDLAFPGGQKVLPWAERLVRPLLSIRAACRRAGAPVIYANDNFGLWRGAKQEIVARCVRSGVRGRDVSRRLRPGANDYFLVKPRHSAFFCTPLLPLLQDLGVQRLILAGMATNMCVLATAHDAKMHGYPIVVLSDCCAAESDFDHNVVLAQLERYFHTVICRAAEVSTARMGRRKPARRSAS